MTRQTLNQQPNYVLGTIADQFNQPLEGLLVEIYDKDMRSEVLLAETKTNKKGKYKTRWSQDQLTGRNRKGADLLIKLYKLENKTLIYSTPLDNIRFNAGPSEVIDITLQNTIKPDYVEYDYLLREVTYLAGEVAIKDLQESTAHQDVTFLSRELNVKSEKIEHLIVSQRLQEMGKTNAAFFYALLRTDTLLNSKTSGNQNLRLSIDINTSIESLFYDTVLKDPNLLIESLKTAQNSNIISQQTLKEGKRSVEALQTFKAQAEKYLKAKQPHDILGTFTQFLADGKLQQIQQILKENRNDLNTILEKISDKSFLSSPLKTKWNKDTFSAAVIKKMEKVHPTTAFTTQLAREKQPILKNQTQVLAFLQKHTDFNLAKDNVDLFLQRKKVPQKESEAYSEQLKSIQRIFKLTPNYTKTQALLQKDIHSAHQIVAMGKTRFLSEVAPAAGIEEKEAKEMFKKAESTNAAAMLLVGELQDTLRAGNIASLESRKISKKLEAVTKDFPNLQSLFKGTDTCACEQCRSVYSPAAYLVEILQFTGQRRVTDLTTNTTSNLAKDVLFNRRPDLAEIDLGCENANTPIPYIDLVCELLEEAIAPDTGISYNGKLSDGTDPYTGLISHALLTKLRNAGLPVTDQAQIFHTEVSTGSSTTLPHYLRDSKAVCKIETTGTNKYKVHQLRQTLAPADELAAAPAYVNKKAYAQLANNNFAFGLPFDLNQTEATAYFNRFNLSRASLMKDFSPAASPISAEHIAAEILGLTDAERILISTPKPTIADQKLIWNSPAQWDTPAVTGDVLAYMKRTDHFLDKTDLSFTDLGILLQLNYIDPDNKLYIYNNDLSCDTTQKEIANLDVKALDRMHRFLRLQKKTGWSLQTLDQILTQSGLGNKKFDTNPNDILIKVAALKNISDQTGIKIEELLGFYGEIPNTPIDSQKTPQLYQQIFLNKAKNGNIDEGLLPEKVNNTQNLAPLTTSLAVCLQLKKTDLEKLYALLPDAKLNFKNLSYLLAASRLIKKLHLKTDDFIIINTLTGINISESPQRTLDFIAETNKLAQAPMKLADIQFILQHQAINLNDRELKDDKILAALQTLEKAYQDNFKTNQSKFDPNLSAEEQSQTLAAELAKLPVLADEDVKAILQFLNKVYTTVADAKTFIDTRLGSTLDTSSIKTALDALDANTGTALDLIKAILDSLSAYQLQLGKQSLLQQTLSTTFKADADLVDIVLKYANLKQAGLGLISDILLSETSMYDAVHYASFKLLHKLFPLITSFNLNAEATEFYFQNNSTLGWFTFDSIPYTAGQSNIDEKLYIAFAQFLALDQQYPAIPDPADSASSISLLSLANMLLPTSATTRDQFLQTLAILTVNEQSDLDAIDNYLFNPFNLNNYTKIETWNTLLKAAADVSTLASEVTQVIQYTKPTLQDTDVVALRAALKSRYTEDTWLSTLKEIMDAIRPQKRNALVAYLLAKNPNIKDSKDLFDYFLVDVEMEAVMPSSRIVQAHGTIQLFVQRCLMGLEPKAAADLDHDASWTQWAWMKNYRVWEANRKVFLYPENWIEADLRDEKSFLFTELEDQLQQNQLTAYTAEDALIKYLEKLDNLAFLEVMATWYQTDITTMHVFARTKGGDPATYYYRRFEQERNWTPWEKVDLDITGDQLLAFVRNNRLCLAWPVFSEIHDPNQGSTLPDTGDSSEQAIDKPRRKLSVQLAISEFADKQWQQKKVSKDGILTPSYYTTDDLPRDRYNMLYTEQLQQVQLFRSAFDGTYEYQETNGIFNIAGCKGYPELIFQGNKQFPDFFPDFKDTLLKSQRYNEWNDIPGDELSVRNGTSIVNYYNILNTTPGNFRISYPHQFTGIDALVVAFELLAMIFAAASGNNTAYAYSDKRQGRGLKLALGTMLPYFMEDSSHAYVIIPGFYHKEQTEKKEIAVFDDAEKKTASDIFKLLQDIQNLMAKYEAIIKAHPVTDTNAFIHQVITDEDFQNIINELSDYEGFDDLYNAMIGITGNAELDDLYKKLAHAKGLEYGEQFKNMYHPLVCSLRTILYKKGVPELMKRETQMLQTQFNFKTNYNPNTSVVPQSFLTKPDGTKYLTYPVEDLDFSSDGSYSIYNWELFFHVPMLLATRLSKDQNFEDALTWFNYIFNPTGALAGSTPQKYWVTKPFFLNQEADYISQRIDQLMYNLSDPSSSAKADLEYNVEQWRNNPFKPHVIAKFRPVAYQKALLMKYLDNLVQWGDNLFSQDTMESIAQATQMYILADKVLGPKPRNIPPVVKAPYETYSQIERKLDTFSNALIGLENILPDLKSLPENGKELPPAPMTLSSLYFCIPQNEQMLTYWDTIADRLFKIRNSQNIDGVFRSLSLFAPPIDPGMLVRAAAAGLSISSILSGMNAPTPFYRFGTLASKATELAQEIRVLGNALLQNLEKKDAESMVLLRNELELKVLNAVTDMKVFQIREDNAQIDVLKRTQAVTQERMQFYGAIEKINTNEQLNLDKLDQAVIWQTASNAVATLGAGLALIPDFALGVSGFGGSPHGAAKLGGSALAHSTEAISRGLGIFSTIATFEANKASIMGGYDRRYDDWKLQERLAIKESASIDQQITAAEIRRDMAQKDLDNHLLQIENAQKSDAFMRSKFTNKELYDWMIGQISSVYFKAYQLAFDVAKKAERCYRFELGNDDSFISYGYWDSMKKGLQSADHLIHDLKRMETSYIDKNKREYELTKHVSLLQLDPLAILRLKATGSCDFDIPEALFDMDYAGQYFRRTKSVSISLPCIAGPYTSVSAKLSLVNNRYRKLTNPDNTAGTGYDEDPGNDERFIYNVGTIQSIAASSAQNDSGVFELNFKDERYLPFEGTGAISSWRLELPSEIRQFDYNTIADVIIHVKYTAREGGSGLKNLANSTLKDRLNLIKQQLTEEGLHVAINMKHEMPNQWNLLKTSAHVNLSIDKFRLPYMAQMLNPEIEEVMLIGKITGNPSTYALKLNADTPSPETLNLSRIDEWKLCRESTSNIDLDTPFELSVAPAQLQNLEDLSLVVKYSFS